MLFHLRTSPVGIAALLLVLASLGGCRPEGPLGRALHGDGPPPLAGRAGAAHAPGASPIEPVAGRAALASVAEDEPDSSRFQQEILAEHTLDEPMELAVASDGRVFFVERKGALKLYEPAAGATRVVARLRVYHQSETGLMGIALDPRFGETGWLYLHYTRPDTLVHRVARFTFTGAGLVDERVVLEVPFEGGGHNAGSLAFDADGNLYIAYGDNTAPFDAGRYAPIDPTPGRLRVDARRTSGNTRDLRGKILRVTPRPEGGYAIPAGNLFTDPSVGRPEIYTMGHRNPFRITVDQRTGYLYWGEVGPDAHADSVLGPRGYDEINQAREAGNFGWPLFIADNKRYRDFNYTTGWMGELFDPERPVNDSPNNTGARVLPPARPAFIWYPYGPSDEFPLVGEGGRNAMAGLVYYHGDYPESGVKLPRYYDGKLLIYDWMRAWMMAVTMDAEGDFVGMEPFLEHLAFDHPIDMAAGPDGSLYVLEYGTYWFARNTTARLSRISYHAGNRPPVARLEADRAVGASPLTVTFSAAGSYDHDEGDALTYAWEFGDGTSAGGERVTHRYEQPGRYVARLVVRDAAGARGEASREILVGNTPPAVAIRVGGNRSFFWKPGPLDYRVEVEDAEDGTLERAIAPADVRVTFDYVPGGHDRILAAEGHGAPKAAGLALIEASDCGGCHGVTEASIGPSYRMIAERYAGETGAVPALARKVIEGGGGVWGEHGMAAHPMLSEEDAAEMVRYILSLGERSALPPAGTVVLDRHEEGDEGVYVLLASYEDVPRHGVGPLGARAEVVLRPPLVRAGQVAALHLVGVREGDASDGSRRPIATAFDDGAYLHLGPTDLTGVGRLRLTLQALRHDFRIELRAGGPGGELLAAHDVAAPEPDSWFEAALPLRAAGEHDLYLVLRSDAGEHGQWNPVVRLDALFFEADATP